MNFVKESAMNNNRRKSTVILYKVVVPIQVTHANVLPDCIMTRTDLIAAVFLVLAASTAPVQGEVNHVTILDLADPDPIILHVAACCQYSSVIR